MAGRQLTLDQALHCAKCGVKASFVEEYSGEDFALGEIVLIECPVTLCREKPWFYCRSCKKRCYRNGLSLHAKRKKHVEQHAIAYPPVPPPPPDPPAFNEAIFANVPLEDDDNDEVDFLSMDADAFHEEMNRDLSKTYINNATSSMDAKGNGTPLNDMADSIFPTIDIQGNEWLARALHGTQRATVQEMFEAFAAPELEPLKNFWIAELGSGIGQCGGGIVYLAARAFQQAKDSQLDRNRFPSYNEALWHFRNLIQYQSMNDKQRLRQSRINKGLVDNLQRETFFKSTFLPSYNQLGRYYGNTGQHSMWNNLPCPKAINIGGVAYMSPKAIIALVMANGIPIDDVEVSATQSDTDDGMGRVHHVSECRKAVQWIDRIRKTYYGNGAPNSKNGAPKFPTTVCLAVSDWTDGFGPGKVKNNRNAVDLKSFTVSPPKDLVNATSNTFAVALGLKKAKGWAEVERRFRAELEELTSSPEPTLFYNGILQKRVPCFIKRFVVMSDKAERNGLTGSLGCGSDTHRCFSISGKIQTPSCKLEELDKFFAAERKGRFQTMFSWADAFVSRDGNANGAVFPACTNCRKRTLMKLGFQFHDMDLGSPCNACSNWDLLPQHKGATLDFPMHQDYPRSMTAGSPVPPPKGRDVFQEEGTLPFVQLDWAFMKQACKFAFFQASRSRKAWNKAMTTCYLKHCGVSTHLADSLHHAAKACAKAKAQDTVDYREEGGIAQFRFPASWLSNEISMRDYIEATMHQLFLGVAESNFELMTKWLADAPAAAKVGVAPFKNVLQTLIANLRGFQLSWLAAYPLTGKKGNLGHGSWVGENWVCAVRISQLLVAWCIREYGSSSKFGVDDLSRMVIAFHAFVARCMTHAGIDDNFISETELYMKEFLSAVREFDLRVRHKVHNKKKKATEKKAAEAWWLKPNYMSLGNLLTIMALLGPLVLWWDGGGKGERFIQVVKPHIKRGVREDVLDFFVNLLEKLYRVLQLELLEKLYGLDEEGKRNSKNVDNPTTIMDILGELADLVIMEAEADKKGDDGDATTASECGNSVNNSDDEDDTSDEEDDFKEDDGDYEAYFSTNETLGMSKKKTIYVYRNENQLNEAISRKKPLAGFVEVTKSNGKTAFEFQTVFRKPVKQLACRKVDFDDSQGVIFHGLWCASITVGDEIVRSTESFADIQSAAKLAAVAIPLWYVVGNERPESNKYCVITNWWKYRMQDGWYRMPTLDPSLYGDVEFTPCGHWEEFTYAPASEEEEPKVSTRIVNGMETAIL